MDFCLVTAGAVVRLGTMALTLAWTHSVQKTRWEEDWQIRSGQMTIVESRVQGSGAGMEPGPNAKFDGRWWRWKPEMKPLKEVILRRSGATADWSICVRGECREMSAYVGKKADPVTMRPCS